MSGDTPDELEAAKKAGWNPDDGAPPYTHAIEPDDAVADGPGE